MMMTGATMYGAVEYAGVGSSGVVGQMTKLRIRARMRYAIAVAETSRMGGGE